jgi:hypothetical protein
MDSVSNASSQEHFSKTGCLKLFNIFIYFKLKKSTKTISAKKPKCFSYTLLQ